MTKRKIIEIDEEKCTGCGECVVACSEGALAVIDGKAKVVNDVFCDGLGACIGNCPEGALKIIEREAPDFDEGAVKEHLEDLERTRQDHVGDVHACGCPSATPMLLRHARGKGSAQTDLEPGRGRSELMNWPVQWRLVQPASPFFKNADILIAADCAPFAYADFHDDFMSGKPVVIGCPKLEEQVPFLDKLVRLFAEAKPKSVRVIMMEVPCCSGLLALTREALKRSGSEAPVDSAVVGIDGTLK